MFAQPARPGMYFENGEVKVEKTYIPKGNVAGEWYLVDASGQTLGRLATKIAALLIGKHRPDYTPGVVLEDHVVVINASQIHVNPTRAEEKKYYRHSGYPGGLTDTTLKDMMRTYPERVIESAVWGMLPHNKYGRALMKRLKIYAGNEHPHAAQNPTRVN